MVLKELSKTKIVLEGIYHLCAYSPVKGNADADYKLSIEIPVTFPKTIPIVREISYKIPRDKKHHISVNPINFTDSLCLGSRIRILQKMSEHPTISGFLEKCVVPFLYSIIKNKFLFGELEHDSDGIFDDYQELFDVTSDTQVLNVLLCLSKKKRIANKQLCPCGCGFQLGKCKLHYDINKIRKLASRNSFKMEYYNLVKDKRKVYLN